MPKEPEVEAVEPEGEVAVEAAAPSEDQAQPDNADPTEAPEQDAEAQPEPEADLGLSEPDNVDHNDACVSAAPPRPSDALISQLEIRWIELLDFVRPLQGDLPGELGEVLSFVRSKL